MYVLVLTFGSSVFCFVNQNVRCGSLTVFKLNVTYLKNIIRDLELLPHFENNTSYIIPFLLTCILLKLN